MNFLEFFEKLCFRAFWEIWEMIITQKTFYEMMENTCKTNSTEVLRHATMQMTSENMWKQGENMWKHVDGVGKHGENIG